jgi:protein-tyrosine kinase
VSKMFDALRRAEAERRRKSDATETASTPPSIDRRTEEPIVLPRPAEARIEPAPHAPVVHAVPSTNGHDPFEGDMLRELGILRNGIESQLEPGRKRVLMFTSAMHGEGVTTLALSYARLLALHGGERVLLVELNARTPSVASRLGLASSEGVTHYFTSKQALSTLTRSVPGGGFDVLPVGEANPTKVQVNLERLLPRLKEEALAIYDTLIIDAPPIVLSPESPPIARYADGVVMVVLSGKTKREVVQRSVNLVAQFDGRVLGVVLNRKRYYIPDFIYRRL